LAGQVIREDFLPSFKKGNYGAGILTGVDRIAGLVENPGAKGTGEETDDFLAPSFQIMITIGFCLFILLGSLFFGIGLGNKAVLPMIFGGLFAGVPLWLSFAVPEFNMAEPYALPFALAGAVWGFLLGRSAKDKGGSSGPGGGWTWGNWSSGSSGGGGGSWGGGGSSGGGGASGSW
jgi:uncharacterized protein